MVLAGPLHHRDMSEDPLTYNHLHSNNHSYEKTPFDTDILY